MSGTRADARKRYQVDAQRAREFAAVEEDRVRRQNRAREVLRDALGEVWSGADWIDTDAVLDHLRDRGAHVEVQVP